jgi:DNA polymerase III epsilon subunit-like protein
MRYFIGDTETTGLTPDRKAIEIAMIEIDEDMNILGECEALLHPGDVPIDPKASETHGMTLADLEGKPKFEEWLHDTWGGPLEGECALIGYRIGFDRPMLEPMFENGVAKMLDVLLLAQNYISGTENHKLQTIKEHLGLPGGPAHRAMGDVITTYQLLQHLLKLTGRPLVAHLTTPLTIIHRMPWGKHKGTLLMQLPGGYRTWLLDLPDLEPNLRMSLELIAKTDFRI